MPEIVTPQESEFSRGYCDGARGNPSTPHSREYQIGYRDGANARLMLIRSKLPEELTTEERDLFRQSREST